MSAKATQSESVQNRQVNCADDARDVKGGERVRVTYESVYGDGSETTLTGTVDRSAISDDVELGRVYIHADGERDRRPVYEDGAPDRHLQFLYDDITLKTKNGGRWNRLSEIGTDPQVEIIER